ncbi:MAG: endonuclease MutS2 [Clostridiales bacterium]|nr:endonuclease MutS2 [Clostridiales bacterium]
MDERTLRILEFDKIISRLASYTSSGLGRELVLSLVPKTGMNEVKEMLRETSDAESFVIRRGSPPLGGIHDVRGSLKRVEMGSILSPGELMRIGDTLRVARNMKNYSSSAETREAEVENIAAALISQLETNKRLEDKIGLAILSEEEIADAASSTLANLRRQIKERQNSIKERLNEMLRSQKYQKFMQDAIVTMRGDRYVIPVKQEYRNEVQGLVHDSSASGATIFIEPMAVVEANNDIKQLKIKEQLEIERILAELTADVSLIQPQLNANMAILARLDFIFAKAKLSLELNCVCPKLNSNRVIRIKKGRHPLLDKKTVVPIDFWIGDEFSTLVITGPNTGGKTVTLKTVGLFVLMAQAGLHVPANDGTELALTGKVFADIGDEQSIEQSLSTFSSHMTNIVKIMAEADKDSLVLFDELGAGTDPTEGAALAMSILEKLHARGTLAIATTHYSELKVYALTTEGVENACCEFNVETLRPTYKLLIGVPGKSNAFAISKRLGLTDDILSRATEFLSQEEIKFEDVLMSIENNRTETEKERVKAESYRREIEVLKKEVEEQKLKFENQKEKLLREAKEESRRLYLEAREDIDAMLKEMRKAQEEEESAERNRAAEEIRLRVRNKLGKVEESMTEGMLPRKGFVKPAKNLKPGDTVLIVNLNQKGTVLSAPDKDGDVLVQAGIMKINAHLTNLKLVDEQAAETRKSGIGKIGISKAMSVSNRIDIRGVNVDEATEILDKFLDDAAMAGLGEITVIHGKGTGALRSGVQTFLKNNGHVKVFRSGRYGEGEDGVTIVEIR